MKNILVFLTSFTIWITSAQTIGDITKSDCFLEDCTVVANAPDTEFGYLTVPENYDDPNSRKLQIAYVILKTANPDFKGDPVIVFQGGWGLPETHQANGYLRMPLLQERDIILFDYRGTGRSTNLPCNNIGIEAWNDLMEDLTIDEFDKNQTKRYADCITEMEKEGIDYNRYGMNNLARDAAFLAQQLPYDTYNLFGISYGTMAIQHFIRAAENYDITVRSAIVDSSVPIATPTQGTMATYYERSLLNVLSDCEKNVECNTAYPNLKERYIPFLATLDENPIQFTMDNGNQAYINKQEINAIVHQLLYNERVYPDIPLLLERIMQHDTEVLRKMIPTMKGKAETSYNATGLVEYVYDHKISTARSKTTYEKNIASSTFQVVDGYLDYYYQDDKIRFDSIANTPIKTQIPTLLLAGSYDPVTPPEWTKSLQNNFVNNTYYELDKVGHGGAVNPCGRALMIQFINQPETKPEAECVAELRDTEISFVTSYHNNAKINYLATDVLQMKNLVTVIITAIVALVLLINLIIGMLLIFKKSATKKYKWRTLAALLGVIMMAGVVYLISQTLGSNGFLLVFGLPNSANYLLICSILFIIASLLFISKLLKLKNFSIWNSISLIAFVILSFGIFYYGLYPNFA